MLSHARVLEIRCLSWSEWTGKTIGRCPARPSRSALRKNLSTSPIRNVSFTVYQWPTEYPYCGIFEDTHTIETTSSALHHINRQLTPCERQPDPNLRNSR